LGFRKLITLWKVLLSFQLSFLDPLLIEKEFIFDTYFGERGKNNGGGGGHRSLIDPFLSILV